MSFTVSPDISMSFMRFMFTAACTKQTNRLENVTAAEKHDGSANGALALMLKRWKTTEINSNVFKNDRNSRCQLGLKKSLAVSDR